MVKRLLALPLLLASCGLEKYGSGAEVRDAPDVTRPLPRSRARVALVVSDAVRAQEASIDEIVLAWGRIATVETEFRFRRVFDAVLPAGEPADAVVTLASVALECPRKGDVIECTLAMTFEDPGGRTEHRSTATIVVGSLSGTANETAVRQGVRTLARACVTAYLEGAAKRLEKK